MKPRNRIDLDVAIVGGGIAGLWLLDRLAPRHRRVACFEGTALGAGQTVASQGILHGGVKYALGGALTDASEAIAAMPARWRACLDGRGEVDLRGTRVVADRNLLWCSAGTLAQLGAFFASRVLRGRIEKLAPDALPPPFPRDFDGSVYALEEPVIDVPSVVGVLARRHAKRIGRLAIEEDHLRVATDGTLEAVATPEWEIRAKAWVFAAGAGNAALLASLRRAPRMQARPLHQVIVRHPGLPALFGHCVGARPEPRLSVTTHADRAGSRVWYLGGALSTDGARRDATAQVAAARAELAACLPWLDLRDAEIGTLEVDRAEPATIAGARPAHAFARRCGNVVVVWPTKLALAPDLGDRVLPLVDELVAASGPGADRASPDDVTLPPPPPVAAPPWWDTR